MAIHSSVPAWRIPGAGESGGLPSKGSHRVGHDWSDLAWYQLLSICVWCVSVQFSLVTESCLTLCNPMNRSMLGIPVHHQLPESTQTYVHWVHDAIQPSHPLLSPSPPAFSLSQHQGLFKWVSCSHKVAKILEFQLQHQFFQWMFRTDFL